jgi:hypothetical protein
MGCWVDACKLVESLSSWYLYSSSHQATRNKQVPMQLYGARPVRQRHSGLMPVMPGDKRQLKHGADSAEVMVGLCFMVFHRSW